MEKADADRGPFIATHSGRWWYLNDPRPDEVDVGDVAWALAHSNRFTGHVGEYSVAAHSLHVAHIVRWLGFPELELDALLHDAHEAYVCDVSAPLKILLPDYREIERRNEVAVRAAFGVSSDTPAPVKRADLMALHDEALAFFPNSNAWNLTVPPSGIPLRLDPDPVRTMDRFLARLFELRVARAS